MDVKLSNEEVRIIAAEVVRQLGYAGLTIRGSASGAPATRGSGRSLPAAANGHGPRLFGIDAAADAVSQHPNTIRRHIRSGRLKAKMINGSYKIKASDLERYARS